MTARPDAGAAVRTYRAMLSEDAVEAVGRVIMPGLWDEIDRAKATGVSPRNFAHWPDASTALATAVIECLLARGEGG